MINENIKEETLLVQKMIMEFFEDKCPSNFTEEKKELIEKIFSKVEVYYSDISSNGIANYNRKTIEIKERLRLNPARVLSYLIHEYAHLFSNRDYKENESTSNDIFEEGVADTFADLVFNHYMEKHSEIIVNGNKLHVSLPYESPSCYKFHNGWIRTMLYPLEKDNKDIEALTEFLLGDKMEFFKMTMGEEFVKDIELYEQNNVINVPLGYKNLYMQHEEAFHGIDKNSFYYRKNHILPAFIIQEKVEDITDVNVYELPNGDKFTSYFINHFYFRNRKIYEISPDEINEFIELYESSSCKEKSFVMEYWEYVDSKMIELYNSDDITKNSSNILIATLAFLKKSFDKMGEYLGCVLINALESELEKTKSDGNLEHVKEIYACLYPDSLITLQKATNDIGKSAYESFLASKYIFEQYISRLEQSKKTTGR